MKRSYIVALGILLWLAFSCATAAKREQKGVVGEFSSMDDLERGMTIIPKGHYRVSLFGEAGKASLSILSDPDRITGNFFCYGLETRESELFEARAGTTFSSFVSGSGEGARRVLRVERGGFAYEASLALCTGDPPAPYGSIAETGAALVESEVEKIARMHEFLGTNAEKIWPGWNEWEGVDVMVELPDGCVLAVTRKESLPRAYRPVEGLNVAGKRVYVDASAKAFPYAEALGYSFHGNEDSGGIRMKIIPASMPEAPSRANFEMFEFERFSGYVHEAFHCGPAFRPGEGMKAMDPSLLPREAVACLINQGNALLRAYSEEDGGKAFQSMREAFASRKRAHALMPGPAVALDRWKTLSEGTAMYAQVRAAMIIDSAPARDYLRSALETEPRLWLASIIENFDRLPYAYGMYWALLLDRFLPGWKEKLLKGDADIDDLLERFLPGS